MRRLWLPPGRAEWLAWAVVAAFSLWLRTGFPTDAISNAMHDDALFVHQARLLAAGHWLGPYNNLTLAKGMMFPLFMAAAQWLALPLNVAEQLAWLAAAGLTASLARRLSGDRGLAFVLFAALAFNPIVWDVQLARVVREGLYLSLSLAAVTLLVALVFPGGASRWGLAARGAAFGLVTGAFWLTREEGPWLLPAFAVVLLAAVPGLWRDRRRLMPTGLGLGVAALAFGFVLGTVSEINARHYGAFITNEFKAAPFQHAYGSLARIHHDDWKRFVVFPKDARARAYSVSPAAKELAGVLDGPWGEAWRNVGCSTMRFPDCTEILSGWFMWALRDAAAQAGHYGSAADAMAYYDRIGREIDAACDAGAIPCGPPRATLMPVFKWRYLRDTLRELPLVGGITLQLASTNLGSLPSEGPREGIAEFADLAGDVSRAAAPAWFARGWVAAASGSPVLSFRGGVDGSDIEMSDAPAPDVAALLPGWTARRFELRAVCAPACDLVAAVGAGEVALPLAKLANGQSAGTPTLKLTVDAALFGDPATLTAARQGLQRRIARALGRGYADVTPALCGVAVVGLLLTLVRPRRPPAGLMALALASAAAVASRIVLLAYLDVTSIPSARVLYTSAATPLVIVFAVLGCWYGARAVWRR